MIRTMLGAAAALSVTTLAAAGQEHADLHIGDEAPALEVSHWLKGEAVNEFEEGQVYVVEFWATWCGPCRAGMPHLTELQEKYDDYGVTIIGISDEPLQKVVEFLLADDWHEKTGYTLATDPDRSAYAHYMQGFGQGGIPTAFIVGKAGKVEWVGHPMNMDDPLERVVRDTWDRRAYAKAAEPRFEEERVRMRKHLELRARSAEARERLDVAYEHEDWPTVIESLDTLIGMDESFERYKLNRFIVLIKELNDPARGYAYGRDVMQAHDDDAMMLNGLAWITVDEDGVKTRDLEFAKAAAKRANELTNGNDPSILDTFARVHYEMGDRDKAIKLQRRAVEKAQGPMRDELEKVLEKYESE